MTTEYSGEELLDFLNRAADRGLMPAATAKALAVASRRILEILSDEERADVRRLDPTAVVKRFGKKRAKDFNPASLKEYGRRFQRAAELFKQWRENPATFSVRTRSTAPTRRKGQTAPTYRNLEPTPSSEIYPPIPTAEGNISGYQSAFPVRPGTVVTILNIPPDLSKAEAERLAQFVRMLAVE